MNIPHLVVLALAASIGVSSMATSGQNLEVECPLNCTCNSVNQSARCSFSELHIFPKLPGFISYLTISSSYCQINDSSFKNLIKSNLTYLGFSYCNIRIIGSSILSNIPSLSILHLKGIPEIQIKKLLFGINKTNVEVLKLENIKVNSTFQSDTLTGLLGSKVKNFTLKSIENMVSLNESLKCLAAIQKFSVINIKTLQHINFAMLNSLSLLYVKNTTSLKFSSCEYSLTQLREIISVENFFYQVWAQCPLPNLKKYVLERIFQIHSSATITNTSFSYLSSLEYLSITTQDQKQITLKMQSLSSKSLKYLKLQNFNIISNTSKILLNFPKLNSISLIDVSVENISNLFGNTEKLQTLKIIYKSKYLSVKSFPKMWLGSFPNLITLSLSGNKVSSWLKIFDSNILSLRKLNISDTSLAVVQDNTIPISVLDGLEQIDVSKNSFFCDCENRWFRNYIVEHKQKFFINGKMQVLKCHTPISLYNKDFLTVNYSVVKCYFLLEILIPCIILLVAVIIIGILLKNRWYIRYLIYMFHGRQKFKRKIPNFVYDGFVIYCDDDREWVHEIFVPKLEENNQFQLCIHFRNFEIGKFIIDNIVDSMNQSKKIILVLSREFLQSDWCQLELKLAQDRMLRDGTDILILVVLESIKNSKIRNNFIASIMNMMTYAEYNIADTENKAFWEQIVRALTFCEKEQEQDLPTMDENTPLIS